MIVVYACIVLAVDLAAALGWMALLHRLDVHCAHKGNARNAFRFFLAGLLSLVLATVLYFLYNRVVFPFDTWNLGTALAYDFLAVGPIEELSKFAVFFLFATRWKSIREPADGVLQAASVGLAFAIVENFKYAMYYGPVVLLIRSVLNATGHMADTALWGFALSAAVVSAWRPEVRFPGRSGAQVRLGHVLGAVALSAALHGLYDGLLTLGQVGPAVLLSAALTGAAVFLYRWSLARSPFRAWPFAEHRRAVEAIGLGLRVFPAHPVLMRRMALYLIYAGEYGRAGAWLDRCLPADPENVWLNLFRGAVELRTGDPAEGRKMILAAIGRTAHRRLPEVRRRVRVVIAEKALREQVLSLILGHAPARRGVRRGTLIGPLEPPGYFGYRGPVQPRLIPPRDPAGRSSRPGRAGAGLPTRGRTR